MPRIAAVLFLFLFAGSPCFADSQPLSFEGIWQATQDSTRYYAIHERGDAIILIDLRRLELTRNSLSSTYQGKLSDLLLSRMGSAVSEVPDFSGQVTLHFSSATEGFVMPVCEVCTVVPVYIRKVF
jgi:hypothetical protein